MRLKHSLQQVIIVPRNGYINRLQAWASASILSNQLGVPLAMYWEPESIAPADAKDLFDWPTPSTTLIDRKTVESVVGQPHAQLPRYVHRIPSSGVLLLAGHDRGEQVFMNDVISQISHDPSIQTLVIIAGGKYNMPGMIDFAGKRSDFYQQLAWVSDIRTPADTWSDRRTPYFGLHVRQTDRSREAPTQRMVTSALRRLRVQSETRSLFIAADSPESMEFGSAAAQATGFDPWTTRVSDHNRGSVEAGRQAMVDWLVLSRSTGIVYSAASTFAHEAAVAGASTPTSIPLHVSRARKGLRQARLFAGAARRRLQSPSGA